MKFKEYKEQVKRTLPHLGSWGDNSIILDSLHCIAGIVSETYEYNMAETDSNIREELTDKAWYATNYANVRGILLVEELHFKEFSDYDEGTHRGHLINIDSELMDYDKKEWAYRKPETEEIRNRREVLINQYIFHLNCLFACHSFNVEEAMQQNIDKLRQRFPDKFDEDKAINRNHEEEAKHLGN